MLFGALHNAERMCRLKGETFVVAVLLALIRRIGSCLIILFSHVFFSPSITNGISLVRQLHVLKEGENLVTTGDDFTAIYHVAQGRIEASFEPLIVLHHYPFVLSR